MRGDGVGFQVTWKGVRQIGLVGLAMALAAVLASPLRAQKAQEEYKDKFGIADVEGGVSIAASADGKYVFVAGRKGVMVSDDYGKTGSWVQTVRLK